jgi:DNA repair exonuclease SbcCD ATPase subunit
MGLKLAHIADALWGPDPGPTPTARFDDICRVMDWTADKMIEEHVDMLDHLRGDIELFRARFDELPAVLQELECRETELRELEARATEADSRVKNAQQELFRAEENWKKIDETQKRNEELRQKLQNLQEQREHCRETIRETDGLLAEEEQILSAAREYEEAKERLGKQRINSVEELNEVLSAWEVDRNARQKGVDWQFTTEDARIKLKRLYPTPLFE